MERLDVADFLLLAEDVLGAPADTVREAANLAAAESALAAPFASFGGIDFYPGLATRAAILCSRVVRNHPLPDGNKRVALFAMLEFLARNGATWRPPDGGQEEEAATIWRLAARELSEEEFVQWVEGHVE
jgi:death-on-curing protein